MSAILYKLDPAQMPFQWGLRSPYNQEMIDALKANIDKTHRRWYRDIREWWFTQDVYFIVVGLANKYYIKVEIIDSPNNLPIDKTAAYQILHLLPSAPDDLIKASYRIMSKIHHPDTGGKKEEMQRVNAAYAKLTTSKS